ncbi:hypothetical protein [Streptomyces sp. NPDC046942]|uniref:hypothetical protein n=1 Tax=Streptomyces sp. NPDC046942 TaxID=3155137 RepID=UPI003402F709
MRTCSRRGEAESQVPVRCGGLAWSVVSVDFQRTLNTLADRSRLGPGPMTCATRPATTRSGDFRSTRISRDRLKTTVERRGTRDQRVADLAQALDDLLHRVRIGGATAREQHLATRHAPAALPRGRAPAQPAAPARQPRPGTDPNPGSVDPPIRALPGAPDPQAPAPASAPGVRHNAGGVPGNEPGGTTELAGGQDADSLDDLSADEDDEELDGQDPWPRGSSGFGLYDARKEAELW